MGKKVDLTAGIRSTIVRKGKSNPHDSVFGSKTVSDITKISLDLIEPNPNNPRKDFNKNRLQELADSIEKHGIIQPITVKKMPGGKYQIISGERRFLASKMANLDNIPAYIRSIDEDQTSLELALIENIQREDLSIFELAVTYNRLMKDFGWTQENLANRIKKGRITITHTLGVLSLPPTIIDALNKQETTMGHVKGLLSFKGKVDFQLHLFKLIQDRKLNVREAEQLIKEFKEGLKKDQKNKHKHQDYIDESLQDLKAFFGAKKVSLNVNSKFKGKLVIPIDRQSDFEFIMKQIKHLE